MIDEVVILAGGFGTRLRPAVSDLPKCMADVAGQPMLEHIIRRLLSKGVRRFIFSLGYRAEVVEAFLRQVFPSLDYDLVIEDDPLGTGGALRFALSHAWADDVLVVNGDSLFLIDPDLLLRKHTAMGAECTLALKSMADADRYGTVEADPSGRILGFAEKKSGVSGLINGGVYLLNRRRFLARAWPERFSLEKDYFARFVREGCFAGVTADTYFIDIGIPEDYARAQVDLAPRPFDISAVDAAWTLFLDRDGVINVNIPNDYVRTWQEFVFEPGAKEAIASLGRVFGRIVVITNQRGVGKGWMTQAVLDDLHDRMVAELHAAGGSVDAILACTSTDDKAYDRKPNPGMAFKARARFPEIDFSRSVMCGDKSIDMQWAKNIGGFGVWIMPGGDGLERSGGDVRFPSLAAFARWILREI